MGEHFALDDGGDAPALVVACGEQPPARRGKVRRLARQLFHSGLQFGVQP